MAKKREQPAADGLMELAFPAKGLDQQTALEYQLPLTTPDCLNVRAIRPTDGRVGGCQRSGVQKYCPTQLASAEFPVQEIHHVVAETGQAQGFGPGIVYVPMGTTTTILDADGNVAAQFPTPSGGTAGPGMFDQRGNLVQQHTTSSTFNVSRKPTAPMIDPVNFQRWPFPGQQFPLFKPRPVVKLGGQGLGGVPPGGENERLRDNQPVGDAELADLADHDDAARLLDKFPDEPADPWAAAPANLPAGAGS